MCPPPAPPYVRAVVPDAGRPTRQTDLARFTWIALWVLLDDFSLTRIAGREAGRLVRRVGPRHAAYLISTSRFPRGETVVADWRTLATAWAAVAVPPPYLWVPRAYRREMRRGPVPAAEHAVHLEGIVR